MRILPNFHFAGQLGNNLRVGFLELLHLHTKATHKQYLHKRPISFFLSGQLGQQSPGWVSGIAPSSHKGHPQTISSQDADLFFLSGQLGQQAPGFVSGIAPSAQKWPITHDSSARILKSWWWTAW